MSYQGLVLADKEDRNLRHARTLCYGSNSHHTFPWLHNHPHRPVVHPFHHFPSNHNESENTLKTGNVSLIT